MAEPFFQSCVAYCVLIMLFDFYSLLGKAEQLRKNWRSKLISLCSFDLLAKDFKTLLTIPDSPVSISSNRSASSTTTNFGLIFVRANLIRLLKVTGVLTTISVVFQFTLFRTLSNAISCRSRCSFYIALGLLF
jgi:hypothetical protein